MLLPVVVVAFLIAFCLMLLTVHKVRPETFKLKASLTKWISIDLEMVAPRRNYIERRPPRHSSRNDGS